MKEQISACFDWMKLTGFSCDVESYDVEKARANYKMDLEKNRVITGRNALSVWVDEAYVKKIEETAAEFVNVDIKDYEKYPCGHGILPEG